MDLDPSAWIRYCDSLQKAITYIGLENLNITIIESYKIVQHILKHIERLLTDDLLLVLPVSLLLV